MCAFYGERKRKEKRNKMGGDNTRVPISLAQIEESFITKFNKIRES